MSQSTVGILCLIASVVACVVNVPSARLAILQLQDRKQVTSDDSQMTKKKWKLCARIATMIVCFIVFVLGVYLLVNKSAASSIATQSATSPVKPEIVVAPLSSTADQSNPRKSSPPKVESVSSTQPITQSKQTSGASSQHPSSQHVGDLDASAQPARLPLLGGQSVGGVSCDGNLGNCAGINNGTQQTNYGVPQPPPRIVNLTKTYENPIKPGEFHGLEDGAIVANPGVQIVLSLSGEFYNPMFIITCDRPCQATFAMARPGTFSKPIPTYSILGRPNMTIIALTTQKVDLGKTVLISVRSQDEHDISVLEVSPFVQPISESK